MPHPQLELAAQHDAAGRHHDAIDALAQGTSAGDLACMTQLGKRLLTGDRAPALATEGARFVLEAAVKGEPEAAARMAALSALGVCCTQSWTEALRWLVVAAERQWQPAREQLQVLAEGQHGRAHRPRPLVGQSACPRAEFRPARANLGRVPHARGLRLVHLPSAQSSSPVRASTIR